MHACVCAHACVRIARVCVRVRAYLRVCVCAYVRACVFACVCMRLCVWLCWCVVRARVRSVGVYKCPLANRTAPVTGLGSVRSFSNS